MSCPSKTDNDTFYVGLSGYLRRVIVYQQGVNVADLAQKSLQVTAAWNMATEIT